MTEEPLLPPAAQVRRAVLFEELNLLTLPLAHACRLAGGTVWFLYTRAAWQQPQQLAELQRRGLRWLSYHSAPDTLFFDEVTVQRRLFAECRPAWFADGALRNHCLEQRRGDKRFAAKMEAGLARLLYDRLTRPARLLTGGTLLHAHYPSAPLTLVPWDWPAWLTEPAAAGLSRPALLLARAREALAAARLALRIAWHDVWRPRLRRLLTRQEATPAIPAAAADAEALFLVHKDIHYGRLFTKNLYYDEQAASPLHPRRLFHLFVEPPDRLSERYCRMQGIPHARLDRLRRVPRPPAEQQQAERETACMLRLGWRDWRAGQPASLLLTLLKFQQQVQLTAGVLASFPAARLALIDYDLVLAPTVISALAARGIVTLAAQERGHIVFLRQPQLFAFDHYAVWGRAQERFAREQGGCSIGTYHHLGIPRSDAIRAAAAHPCPKYEQIRRQRRLVVALDWHSSSTPYDMGSAGYPSISRNNRAFYTALLRLARAFPGCHFVVKGKNTDFVRQDYYRELLASLTALPNFSIESQLRAYRPATMMAQADLVIACHTSLAEEALACGKPAVLYNPFAYPPAEQDAFAAAGIVAHSDAELQDLLTRWQDGAWPEPAALAALRQEFYGGEAGGAVAAELRRLARQLLADPFRHDGGRT